MWVAFVEFGGGKKNWHENCMRAICWRSLVLGQKKWGWELTVAPSIDKCENYRPTKVNAHAIC